MRSLGGPRGFDRARRGALGFSIPPILDCEVRVNKASDEFIAFSAMVLAALQAMGSICGSPLPTSHSRHYSYLNPHSPKKGLERAARWALARSDPDPKNFSTIMLQTLRSYTQCVSKAPSITLTASTTTFRTIHRCTEGKPYDVVYSQQKAH